MPRLTDEQVNAIQSINSHVLVSAGAGSGKTFVLVERYINILRSHEDAQVGDIIAVTYTRKAAEEMRSRLKAELTKVVASCQDELSNLRWSKLLSELESARIGTIHSLCESILKNFPAEAGIDPDFAIMDDLERAEILNECLDDLMRRVIAEPSDAEEALLDYPIEMLKDWLAEFLKSSLKYKQARAKFAEGSIDSIRKFCADFIDSDLARILKDIFEDSEFVRHAQYVNERIWDDPESKLGVAQREMLRHLRPIQDRSLSVAERWQAVIRLGTMESARTAGGEAGKDLRESMKHVRSRCSALTKKNSGVLSCADDNAFLLLSGLVGLADQVVAQYDERKRLHQKLDFDDLIERCHHLLTTGASARRQLTRGLRAVLVDEFQDTNWMQAQMLCALASDHAKLFLIGDDKQSIYKFQGADVGTFNSCKSYIRTLTEGGHAELASSFSLPVLDGQGALMTLSQSFRSHPEIVHFVNTVFRRLFDAKDGADTYKSRFQALRPARDKEDEEVRIDIVYTAPVEGQSAEERNAEDRAEGQQIAKWILDKISSGAQIFDKELGANRALKYSDFAVLLQANADFAAIEFALGQAKIPYVSIAGSGFLERQEVFDLENMLKWLDCPQDSYSLFAVLRSPMFGISDDIIHELASHGKGSLWQNLRSKADEPGEDVLHSCVKKLQELQRQSGQLSLPEVLRKIILDTAYDIVLLAGRSGKQRSRNVWKFLSLACKHRQMSIGTFLESLSSMRELGVKNLTDAPLSADDSVRLMTIHRSKGLEFGAVILPRLGKSALERSSKLIFAKDYAIALDPTRDSEEEKPTFFSAANKLSSTMGEEEKKRLLYVALTRARDYLALFMTSRSRRAPSFGSWLVAALDLPEPGSEVYEGVCQSNESDDPCNWRLLQEKRDDSALIDEANMLAVFESADAEQSRAQMEFLDAPLPSGEHAPSDESFDALMNLDFMASESTFPELGSLYEGAFEEAEDTLSVDGVDLSLIPSELSNAPQYFKPVPWQALVRVTRTASPEQQALVNQTILGNYFHLLMNNLGSELEIPSEQKLKALCRHHSVSVIDPAAVDFLIKEGTRLLGIFKESPLHSVMKNANRRLHEQQYLIMRDGKTEELRPDLLLQTADGSWQIVDYKTDHFELREMKKQLASHSAQLAVYVDDIETVLSTKASAWIYFAQYGRLEPVSFAPAMQLSLPILNAQ